MALMLSDMQMLQKHELGAWASIALSDVLVREGRIWMAAHIARTQLQYLMLHDNHQLPWLMLQRRIGRCECRRLARAVDPFYFGDEEWTQHPFEVRWSLSLSLCIP